jgi:hypothetical protein
MLNTLMGLVRRLTYFLCPVQCHHLYLSLLEEFDLYCSLISTEQVFLGAGLVSLVAALLLYTTGRSQEDLLHAPITHRIV